MWSGSQQLSSQTYPLPQLASSVQYSQKNSQHPASHFSPPPQSSSSLQVGLPSQISSQHPSALHEYPVGHSAFDEQIGLPSHLLFMQHPALQISSLPHSASFPHSGTGLPLGHVPLQIPLSQYSSASQQSVPIIPTHSVVPLGHSSTSVIIGSGPLE